MSAALAAEWGDVPAYADSLEALLGPGSMPELVAAIERTEAETTALARALFAAWLEEVVGVTPAATANERTAR